MYDGHIRDVDLHEVVLARAPSQLAHGLDKRHALDVAHCASQLDYADIGLFARVIDRYPRHLFDPVLNRIGDVRNDLYGFTQIVSLALAFDDVLVNLASGDVVVAGQSDVEVTLVVAEIEVNFTAVGEDKDFAVPMTFSLWSFFGTCERNILLGVHRSCVDIEVWVDLDRRDVLSG